MASSNEKRAKELGMTVSQYKKTDEYKNKKKKEEADEKRAKGENVGASGSDLRGGLSKGEYEDKYGKEYDRTDLSENFDEFYDEDMENEDIDTAKKLWEGHFEQQITMQLEDLNDFAANSNVNYNRSLRTARSSLAKMGGAIGSERTTEEGEIKQDKDRVMASKINQVKGQVGTEEIQKAGYKTTGVFQEGALNEELEYAIENEKLDLQDERSTRFYAEKARIADNARTF